MKDQDWKKVEELFHLLLQKEKSEWDEFLAQVKRDDPILHDKVAALLISFEDAGQFLETPVCNFASELTTEDAASDSFPSPGQQFDHFQIVRKLGEGGMGKVFLAEDKDLERKVALKFLPEALHEDLGAHRRFMREAKSAAALDHPFICNVHEVRQTQDGRDFIVMEFVEGETLKDKLDRESFSVRETLRIATEVTEALEAAHRVGIIHRDLKPSNIMLAYGGHAKVMDFGLAKRVSTDQEGVDITAALTGAGTTLGTLAYMSPEQLTGENVDQRSDLFSLGIVLYEMLTGVHPFRRARQVDTFNAILNSVPEPFSEHDHPIPQLLQKTVQQLLEKTPERRYQTAGELQAVLSHLVKTLDQPVAEANPRSYLWSAIPVSSALTVFVLAVVWWFWSSDRPTQLRPVPLTSYVGQEREPTLSPDGSHVAFSWDGEEQDNFDIYVKRIGPGEPLRLTTHPARDFSPAWSPDNRFVAFLRAQEDGTASLLLLPPLGGLEQQKAEIHAPYQPAAWDYGHFLSWSPDSKWLAFCDRESKQGPWKIFLLSIQSGESYRLTNPPDHYFGDKGPLFSPKGGVLVFSRLSEVILSGDLYKISVPSPGEHPPPPERLTSLGRPIDSLAWVPNTQEIIFFTQGTPSTWRTDISAPDERLQSIPELDGSQLATALHSTRMVYSESSKETNIWCAQLHGSDPKASEPRRIIASTRSDMSPDFSLPDGRRIAFISTRSGNSEIWICNSDGSSPLQLTSLGGPWVGGPRWSPDGKLIAFDSRKSSHSDIYLISAGGGEPIRLTNDPGQDGEPTWSRDGTQIYFNSDRSGTTQVWRMPSKGGPPVQVTSEGGSYGQEAVDGQSLFFKKADLLYTMPLEGGRETQVLKGPLSPGPSFAAAENGIYFIPRSSNGKESIRFYDYTSGSVVTIVASEKDLGWGIAIAPDLRTVLYPQVDYIHSDLKLVEDLL